ncbi:hypothetical protein [Bacillus weihaiensis]|uniref:hypothetical protein n=1 Tax=Bacillus weihaiensis TaxID=1547283 RepID=UPI00235800DD|nr:hypothetical protein [Bacillus weihaiensis]
MIVTSSELGKESTTITCLENSYIHRRSQFKGIKSNRPKGKVYYALDDCDSHGISLDWYEEDVEEVDRLYTNGLTVKQIAKHFKRNIDDVAILIIDRAIKGKIQPKGRFV